MPILYSIVKTSLYREESMKVNFLNIFVVIISFMIFSQCKKSVDVKSVVSSTKQLYKQNKQKFFNVFSEISKKYPQFSKLKTNVTHIYFSDFDHTLANTETRIPVKRANGKDDSTDSKCMVINKGDIPDFGIFKKDALFKTKPIEVALARLKQAKKVKTNFIMVLTARSQDHTFTSAHKYLKNYNLNVDYVIAVNSKLLQKDIWKNLKFPTGMSKLPKGMKKPLLMRAFVEYAQMKGVKNLKKITYMEDTDKYIGSYMTYMPKDLGQVQARVFDYVRGGSPNQRSYTELELGTSRDGMFYTPIGKIKNPTWGYQSNDCKK